jgi:nucleotide-binding universal stress UspA family protein
VILVGIDGGAGSVAVLQSAARLADLVGGSILVAHVVAAPQGPAAGYVALEDSSLGDIEADLFPEVVEALVDSRAGWTITTAYGNPASELVRLARQHEAAAIVVGADTPGWTNQLRRISTGSVPSRLVHQQPAPVIVIPEGCSRRPALSGS